ncbi:C1 family peptidase [[Micrococcus luteus] ATCC 49442]|uniref:C1 family peptidase n=1 Tax=[Micrococcus luteus] ATCC 49442 TaxID=2698727 RepID=UPI0013D98F5C|nr:C1 family peptidase [[Micrococcus luteus] ATCC 49442]
MIYTLARRYDEFPGNADEGSSLRGALKGWYYHGVLPEKDWQSLEADPEIDLNPDLALKALRHPLGAFYRVNAFRLDDMQSAVNELHAVVASARIHSGWKTPQAEQREDDGTTHYIIRRSSRVDQLGGHAFTIVGYNDIGFLVQNSWGPAWGRKGFATLTYEDWLVSAYDAWVARPGVPSAVNLRKDTKVVTATTGGMAQGPGPDLERLKNHVVNLGNNGQLSGTGRFVSSASQINKIVENIKTTHSEWASRSAASNHAQPRRIVLYAHGGLVDENAGLRTAQAQLNWWLNNEVYPVTFAWQSGPIETFISQLEDITKDLIPFGGLGFDLVEQADRLVEKIARSRLRWMWDEMKENAEKSSSALLHQVSWRPTPSAETEQAPGASLLVSRLRTYVDEVAPEKVEVHLVGHSAGAIFTAHLLSRLAAEGIPVTTLSWLAPAITVDEFKRLVVPLLDSGNLERFTSYGLSEAVELDDVVGTAGLKIYQKSLLYLVSRALEGNGETPLVGLQRDMGAAASTQLSNGRTNFFWSPSQSPLGGRSSATSHGGMDEDMLTMTSVLLQILAATDVTQTATFRPFTTLDARSPGSSSEKASPAEAETVNVQPAGEVPVTHMGQPQDAHDKGTEKER